MKLLLFPPQETTIPANKLKTWRQTFGYKGSSVPITAQISHFCGTTASRATVRQLKGRTWFKAQGDTAFAFTAVVQTRHSRACQSHAADTNQRRRVLGRTLSLGASAAS